MDTRPGARSHEKSIAVAVTPIWLPELTSSERQNVMRTIAVSGDVPHVFLAPRSMPTDYYEQHFPASAVRTVDDRALVSLTSYSRLMLSSSFYRMFADFEFVIIVQTDAFLTRSPAALLVDEQHDYIGAPWQTSHSTSALTNYFPRSIGRLETAIRGAPRLTVGNGGLSIRRTAALAAALRSRPLLSRFSRVNEDVVLSYLGGAGVIRVAPEAHAAGIFFEQGEIVPEETEVYGFHALERYYPDTYRAYANRWA